MWSDDVEKLLGYSALEAVGQSIEIIIPHHLRERHWAGLARYVQTGISTLPEITTAIAVHKTGKHMKLLISVKAIYGEDKEVAAVEATFYPSPDLTYRSCATSTASLPTKPRSSRSSSATCCRYSL
jgi:PAS domain S-box-containing protein